MIRNVKISISISEQLEEKKTIEKHTYQKTANLYRLFSENGLPSDSANNVLGQWGLNILTPYM